VRGDIRVDSDVHLVTDFLNLKIKSTQSFGCVHRGRVCVCVYRGGSSYVYIYLHHILVGQYSAPYNMAD
jgi:hypothetical protein